MDSTGMWIAAGLALIAIVIVLFGFFRRAREVELYDRDRQQKPDYVRTTPPNASIQARKADGAGFGMYDEDTGERLAQPFAEQIEDVVRSLLQQDPELQNYEVDFGSDPQGGLEIWINETKYNHIDEIKDEKLAKVFKEAIASWEESQTLS